MSVIIPVNESAFTQNLLDHYDRRAIIARLRGRELRYPRWAAEGDWVRMPTGETHRIAYINGTEGHRRTQFANDPERQFFLEINGLMNYRGNVRAGVPLEILHETQERKRARCTILHHRDSRLIEFDTEVTVWRCPPLRQH
ncbi:hypothetical protein ACIBCN_19080 [Nocardia sp. NPDC051052]|uniref:hypothetical protein n=1 Tax=Nocardia sp. NPDC051052 TaxID=3364322 RepID=UPI0037897409